MPRVLYVLSASWSPFRMVDVSGNTKKMLELRLGAKAKLGEGTTLTFTANGGVLDEEELQIVNSRVVDMLEGEALSFEI